MHDDWDATICDAKVQRRHPTTAGDNIEAQQLLLGQRQTLLISIILESQR